MKLRLKVEEDLMKKLLRGKRLNSKDSIEIINYALALYERVFDSKIEGKKPFVAYPDGTGIERIILEPIEKLYQQKNPDKEG